ncbi:hypothetical protein ACE1CI_16725 [Aerosakkonemataceae cyanobacterium BLCC-F50]|uniref:Rhodanese domain-containing protein n=1 Tax=Floridaenema flaviceps BLCC-F50 TaxID=3153642 RepID=A0ABV4XSB4_9CYAN
MINNANSEVVVDTQWLADRQDDPNLRIVEVEMRKERYHNAHLPGVVFWNIFTDLLLPDLRMNLDPNAIKKLLSRLGITNETSNHN